MRVKKILARTIAKLDSSVHHGGGTDDTKALQAVLDEAKDGTAIHLVMDGAALITGLTIHSNTTIECLNRDCGFYLADHCDCPILRAGDLRQEDAWTENIRLLGGTYNHNGAHQDVVCADFDTYEPGPYPYPGVLYNDHGPYTLDLYGVRFLQISGLCVRNFRAYAVCIDRFENVTIENTWLQLDEPGIPNQDGFHFFGPGRFLTVRNVGGKVGDDFMNIGSDERDRVSSITDVLIDGVFLDHATQAIRLLARHEGSVERVTIRNVSGTYRNFGFYICPWYMDHHSGTVRDVLIENVNLVAEEYDYDYRERMLFCVAGIVDNLTIRNVTHRPLYEKRPILEIGIPFYSMDEYHNYQELCRRQKIRGVTLQNITVTEDERETEYIKVYTKVDSLILKDITILSAGGSLLTCKEEGSIDTLIAQNIHAPNLTSTPEQIETLIQ